MALLGIYSADEGSCFANTIAEIISMLDEGCLAEGCSMLLDMARENNELDWFFDVGFRNLVKLKQKSFVREVVDAKKEWIFSHLAESLEKDLLHCSTQSDISQDDVLKKLQVSISLLDLCIPKDERGSQGKSFGLEPVTFEKLSCQGSLVLQSEQFTQELKKGSSVLLTKLLKSVCQRAADKKKSFHHLLINTFHGRSKALEIVEESDLQDLNYEFQEVGANKCLFGSLCLVESFLSSEDFTFFHSDPESPDIRLWEWIVAFSDLVSQESEVRELFQTLSIFVKLLSTSIHRTNMTLADENFRVDEMFYLVNISSVMSESFRVITKFSGAVSSGPLQYRVSMF
eukprot:472492-Hanusia_phi.AAC.6